MIPLNKDFNALSISNGKLINRLSTNNIRIPEDLVSTVNSAIIENIISANKKELEKVLEITIKPDLQKGIEKGKLVRDKGSLVIRNKQSGKIVGKANLEESLVELKNTSPLSTIANLSGQIQMAEISQKLDIINNKIDLIGKFQWREKISELRGLKQSIEEAVESLPNKHAIERINDSIIQLNILSNFFKNTIEELLNKKIEYKLSDNILEGFKVWEWSNSKRKEYNSKYNNEIQSFINEYGFLIDLYFQTLGLIGTCYQITNEYHHASNYFKKIDQEIAYYSHELADRLILLLDMHEVSTDNRVPLQSIVKNLEDRMLPSILSQEINLNDTKLQEARNMYEKLTSQFENIQLSYEIDSQLLEGGNNHD